MQVLKKHGLNITSLKVLLKAVERSADLLTITVRYEDNSLVSPGLMQNNIKQGGAEHKFLKNNKIYSLVFITYSPDTWTVLLRTKDLRLYCYNMLKAEFSNKERALEEALLRHIVSPNAPIELLSRDNRLNSTQPISVPEEPLDYTFTKDE